MKRLMAALAVTVLASAAFAPRTFVGASTVMPNGSHFTLNIHGVANGQGWNGNNQNDIFVPLQGKCQINLFPGDFQVLQPDCVDNPSATFQLPNPVTSTVSTATVYSVWARALGTPGGKSSTTTCAYDSTGTLVCSIGAFVSVQSRTNGKPSFSNVTQDLLYLTTCVNGKSVSTPLFGAPYQNYFWEYDNQGLRLLQLRFYQVPSNAPTSISC